MREIQAIRELQQETISILQQIAQCVESLAGRFRSELGGGVPVAVAAKRLGMHPRTLIIKLKTKELPGYRIGRRWFVQMDQIFKRKEGR